MDKTLLFDKIPKIVYIKTPRLTLTEIKEQDRDAYYNLYVDDELNKWWGYDYREDLGDREPTPDYFFAFQNLLKDKKEEYSFAIRENDAMVGELVLHNFGEDSVEMGFRLTKSAQGKGYAIESAKALKEFVFSTLGAKILKSRCYKQNLASKRLIENLGLEMCDESQTHYFFQMKK